MPNTPTGRNICCSEGCSANLGEVCTGDNSCCEGYCSDYGEYWDGQNVIKGPLLPEDWHCCSDGFYWDAFSGVCTNFQECYGPLETQCNYNNTNETEHWTDPDCFDDTVNPPLITDACCGVDWYGNLTYDMMDIYVYPWNYTG